MRGYLPSLTNTFYILLIIAMFIVVEGACAPLPPKAPAEAATPPAARVVERFGIDISPEALESLNQMVEEVAREKGMRDPSIIDRAKNQVLYDAAERALVNEVLGKGKPLPVTIEPIYLKIVLPFSACPGAPGCGETRWPWGDEIDAGLVFGLSYDYARFIDIGASLSDIAAQPELIVQPLPTDANLALVRKIQAGLWAAEIQSARGERTEDVLTWVDQYKVRMKIP